MTFNWPRLTWPALAMRQAAPWSRKMSATSRAGRATSAGALGGRLVWLQPERREPIERAHDHADGVGSDARIERRGLELGVPEQHLDHADVDVLLQQVSREAVAQRVRRDPLGDLGPLSGGMDGPVELTRGERVDRGLSGKEPHLRGRAIRPQSRRSSRSCGESIAKRSLRPLPCSILSSMRRESTSLTLSATTSDTRRPAP